MGFHWQWTMWLWRNPDNVTHRRLLSIDQVWRRSTALTWSRWGCRRLADNTWLLAHDNNNWLTVTGEYDGFGDELAGDDQFHRQVAVRDVSGPWTDDNAGVWVYVIDSVLRFDSMTDARGRQYSTYCMCSGRWQTRLLQRSFIRDIRDKRPQIRPEMRISHLRPDHQPWNVQVASKTELYSRVFRHMTCDHPALAILHFVNDLTCDINRVIIIIIITSP